MKFLLTFSLSLFSLCVNADGLIRTTNLKQYCGQEGTHRQTIIYLDQSIIAKTDANWYRDILNKTKFLPGERIQVVTINDGGSTVELAWDTCYPEYTASRYSDEKNDEGFASRFTGGVDDRLKNDLAVFNKQFQQALAHPLQGTKHDQIPKYSDDFPMKKLVEAFYYDSSRLDLGSGIPRVIVFSDMVENSDLLAQKNFEPSEAAGDIVERFPVFFNHASFYIYGINYTNNKTALNENLEKFWRRYFIKSGAEIAQYGTQLVLPRENKIEKAMSYNGRLTQSDGKKLATSLRIAYLPSGDLIHSWIAIGDNYMTLSGNYECSGKNCALNAKINESGFSYFKNGDILKLSGTSQKISGEIGGRDDSVIDEKGNIYRFDIEFEVDSNLSM